MQQRKLLIKFQWHRHVSKSKVVLDDCYSLDLYHNSQHLPTQVEVQRFGSNLQTEPAEHNMSGHASRQTKKIKTQCFIK